MSRFAIFVTVRLKSGAAAEFKPIALENAAAAVRDEPHCHQFHVMQSEDDEDVFHFYEIYTNAAALDTHREQPHYQRFAERAAPLILERTLRKVEVFNPLNSK